MELYTTDKEDATKRVAKHFIIENLKEKSGGIFGSFKEADPKYEWMFNDFEFDGRDEFTLILSGITLNSNETLNYHVELSAISEDYYKYLESLSRQNNADGDPVQERVVAYTNIKRGLGIFAATNKVHKKVEQ